MKTKLPLELEENVVAFIRRLAPEPRRRVRKALDHLSLGKGDIKALEEDLAGYYRLRTGPHRFIFRYLAPPRATSIRIVFAEHRRIVYELFAQSLGIHAIRKLRD